VADQTEKPRLQGIIVGVRSRVLEGHALAQAMADFPGVFPMLYRTTVGAGEQSGHLDLVLERLADYTEFIQQIRQKVLLAVLYPIILSVVAIFVVGALLTYVVPKIVDVFENLHQELPVLTRGLIQVSGFLRAYGLLLLVGLVALAIVFRLLLRREGVRLRFDRTLFRVPLLARFSRSMNAARFARTFSILTASGVPVLEGMHISAQVIGNLAMRQAVVEAASRVREGSSVHKMLAKSGYFPPITIHLIASGEASAKLEEMLERAAVNQEREVETLISTLMGIFEPMLILLMGGVVLIIVLAILLPIFDLNALVR
jgi:general secretion pathway protein F